MAMLDALLATLGRSPSVLGMPGVGDGQLPFDITGAGGPGAMSPMPVNPFSAPPAPPADQWRQFPALGLLNMPTAPAAATDTPPSTNDPFSREPQFLKDGVPLPRPRPDGIGAATDDSALPPAAAPTQATPTATSSPLDGVKNLLSNALSPSSAPTLLALASGFAGAPSFGTGMRRAFSAATPAVAAKQALDLKQGMIAQTYRALVAKGVPPEDALAAAMNPDIMKVTASKYFEAKPPQWAVTGVDMYGQPTHGFVDVNKGTVTPGAVTPPPNVAKQPMSFQRQVAPDGTPGVDRATGRAVLKKGGGWVYADDSTPVPK